MSNTEALSVPVQTESKSSRKKKAKAEAAQLTQETSRSPSVDATGGQSVMESGANGIDTNYESPYIKELYKNIRNIKKKLNATQKVDSIIAENPDKTLDELLAARKINQDQKVQAQKKPALQASLAQLEEQIAQYKQFDEDYQKRLAIEKSALESSHRDELEKVKEAATAAAKLEGVKETKDSLLVLSKFLRAAAAKRQDGDETTEENRAFEGALLLVYGGDANAVTAMQKLIEGSDDKVPAVDGSTLSITYKQIRESSFEHAPPSYAAEEAWVDEVAQAEPIPPTALEAPPAAESDPTILHAGLTEIEADAQPLVNGTNSHVDSPDVPGASNVDVAAANEAAGENWGSKLEPSMTSGPDEWVDAQRDPAETDTDLTATSAAPTNNQTWADDVPGEPPATGATAPLNSNGNDGFHEVHHTRGRGRGSFHGEHRGGRGRGGFRGDRGGEGGGHRGRGGYRGNRGEEGGGGYRGRGRGGPRGQRGRGGGEAAPL
ncbi:MAG: hypothetical protein MMC33_006103 [Icmadophila ericetorum]|nr:hypothetical protein [Icmadophila ericetorum]